MGKVDVLILSLIRDLQRQGWVFDQDSFRLLLLRLLVGENIDEAKRRQKNL